MVEPPKEVSVASLSHLVSIKLSSTSFLLWRTMIEPVLSSHDLFGHVDGTVVPPSRTVQDNKGSFVPNPDYIRWFAKDQRVLSLIFSSLTEETMSEALGCKTALSAWKALHTAFSHPSTSHALHLKGDLLSLRKGNSSVDDYGRKFKLICDQLAAIDRPVDEVDKSHLFLRGLGSQFTNFGDVRMAMVPVPSFRDLVHQAKGYETLYSAMNDPAPAAFVVQSHPNFGGYRGHARTRGGSSNYRGHRGGGSSDNTSNSSLNGRGKQHQFSDRPH